MFTFILWVKKHHFLLLIGPPDKYLFFYVWSLINFFETGFLIFEILSLIFVVSPKLLSTYVVV